MDELDALLQVSRDVGIGELYSLIGDYPKVLDVDKDAVVVETPLHKAVRSGCREVAMEILQLMPAYGRKLNPQGHSPLHIALREGYEDLVRDMIKLAPDLVRVKGREGMTPLHYVAEENQVDLVAEFLLRCPDSIRDLTVRGETAVHVAVKSRNLEAAKVLVGWVRRKGMIGLLALPDWKGNSVMDLAKKDNETEVMKLLDLKVESSMTRASTRRFIGQVFSHSNNQTFVEYLSSTPKDIGRTSMRLNLMKLKGETRNAMLVVAVLIATATFQAILSDHGSLMERPSDLRNFTTVNSIAFSLSMAVILFAMPMHPSNGLLYLSVVLFSVTYILTIKITSPDRITITIVSVLLPIITYVFGLVDKMMRNVRINETHWRRIMDKTNYSNYQGGDVAEAHALV